MGVGEEENLLLLKYRPRFLVSTRLYWSSIGKVYLSLLSANLDSSLLRLGFLIEGKKDQKNKVTIPPHLPSIEPIISTHSIALFNE